VRAVLQVTRSRVIAERALAPESAASLVPQGLSQLRIKGSAMNENRADLLLEAAARHILECESGVVVLNGRFIDEQLDAISFLLRNVPEHSFRS
jgi:hypothetical protein